MKINLLRDNLRKLPCDCKITESFQINFTVLEMILGKVAKISYFE
jgi:hypothetical protein